MSIKCRIWWADDTQSYVLNCTPCKELKSFVALLKSAIPAGDRDYDPRTYFWYFKEAYGDGVRSLAQSIYGIASVSFISKQAAQQAQANRPFVGAVALPIKQAFNEFIALCNTNGNDVIDFESAKRAYRRASTTLHPDRGGSPEQMAKLNELWKRVKEEYYHK